MFPILISAAVTCLASLFVGQAALRLCGAPEWSWLAPPVGLSVLMLVSVTAKRAPGHATTVAVLLAILTVAALIWCLAARPHRPPLGGILAAAPVAFLVLVPFIAVGLPGILGVTVDNDMAAHLRLAEIFFTSSPDPSTQGLSEYPVGPHAMSAVISAGLDVRIDHAFTGWTMALPILNAWTALAFVSRAAWVKRAIVATLVSMPFLVAAYYAQGSFKEVAQAGLVLAFVVYFCGCGPQLGRGKWVPLALLTGGVLSVYSATGIVWPAGFFALWLLGLVAGRIYRQGPGGLFAWARDAVRSELPGIGIALLVGIVLLIPQVRRIHNFISVNFGSGGIVVPKDVLANLVAPLPGWEAFGVWNNIDYRLPSEAGLLGSVATAFVFALVIFGVWWCFRRGRWMLPLAAAVSMLIWANSIRTQSPYTVAKALVIVSPLLLALAVLPLVEQLPDRVPRRLSALFRRVPRQPFPFVVSGLLLTLLVLAVGTSDLRALRASPIGPENHGNQLRELKPLLDRQRTLFLGNDDFAKWELSGVPVDTPVLGAVTNVPPIRPEKGWELGMPLDFDAVDAATLDGYEWVITTRDAAGSAPPPQFRLVATTQDYELWHRVGDVEERSILSEAAMSGAVLDCSTPEGQAILRAGGVAAVRPAPVTVPAPILPAGGTATVALELSRGNWQLESSYTSRVSVDVTGPGLDVTLPPNLDRPGPRLPIGEVAVSGNSPTELTFHVDDPPLAPAIPYTTLLAVTASHGEDRVVPIARACGKYVDWYRSAGARDGG